MDDFRRKYAEAKQRRLPLMDAPAESEHCTCPCCHERTLAEVRRTHTRGWVQTHWRCASCRFTRTTFDIVRDDASTNPKEPLK